MSSASAINDIKADQIVAGIREWVALETPPHDVKRLTEFSELATHQAKQAGLTVDTIPVGDSKQPLVRIRAPSDNNEKSVLVLAHYDTVHPVGTVERNKLRIESDKMYGPGTYDMKAGGYLALQAMAALFKEHQPARPVELLLVPDEIGRAHV